MNCHHIQDLMTNYLGVHMKLILILTALAIFGLTLGCDEGKKDDKKEDSSTGDDDDDDDNDDGAPPTGKLIVSVLDQLPNVTDPVLGLEGDADTTAFNNPDDSLNITLDASLVQNTGVSLGKDTKATYYDGVTSPAYGSCEMVNRMRGILHEAASADLSLCDFKTFFKDDIPATIMDGKPHVVEITEGGEAIELYRVTIVKTGEKITDLTYQRCEEGKQDLYVKKSVDAEGNVKITSKRSGQDNKGPNNISYKSITDVSGKVDEKGKFVGLKEMTQTYSNDFKSDGTDVSYNKYKVVQSAENLALVGYATQTTAEDDDRLMSFFELVDNNTAEFAYDLNKLAVGPGAIVWSSGSVGNEHGWADKGAKDDASKWLKKVEGKAGDLPTPPSSSAEHIDFSFSGEEAWDCSGEPSVTIADEDLEIPDDYEPCEVYQLPQDQSYHLQCHKYK